MGVPAAGIFSTDEVGHGDQVLNNQAFVDHRRDMYIRRLYHSWHTGQRLPAKAIVIRSIVTT